MIKVQTERHNPAKWLRPNPPFSPAHSLPREHVAAAVTPTQPLSNRTWDLLRELCQLQYKSIAKRCVFFSDHSINLALSPKETYKNLGLPVLLWDITVLEGWQRVPLPHQNKYNGTLPASAQFSDHQLSIFLVEASFETWHRSLNSSCCCMDTHLQHLLQSSRAER